MEIFRMALKIHKECAKHTALPLGLMEDHFPRGLYNKAGYLGIWNPTSRAERIQILLPEGLGPKLTRSTNLWDNRRIPWRIEDDTLEMSLAPFESVLTKV
jgi:alpha-galactosidase